MSNDTFKADMTIAEYWDKYGKQIRARMKAENEANQIAADALRMIGISPQTIFVTNKNKSK